MSAELFHAHLDVCSQCSNNPFALCQTGSDLIHKAVGATPPEPRRAGMSHVADPTFLMTALLGLKGKR